MSTLVDPEPDLDERIRRIVQEELNERLSGRRGEWSQERAAAALDRILERRRRIGMPDEVVDALLQQHRQEIGRGPLTEDDE